MNRWFALLGSLVLGIVAELLAVFLVSQSASAASPCVQRFYQGVSYVVCTLDLRATQAQPASLTLAAKNGTCATSAGTDRAAGLVLESLGKNLIATRPAL